MREYHVTVPFSGHIIMSVLADNQGEAEQTGHEQLMSVWIIPENRDVVRLVKATFERTRDQPLLVTEADCGKISL